MSNDGLTIFCTLLGMVVYILVLSAWFNSGLRDELSTERVKIIGLELDMKYLKEDVKRLEKVYWELRK